MKGIETMVIPKLALRNLLGAGLRTWLNVLVLSFSYVAIIWMQGIYKGMNDQVEQATIEAQYGGGQYWHKEYDPYDPLSLDKANGIIPDALQERIVNKEATPILIRQGTIYPEGRFRTVLLKGIDPAQSTLIIPSSLLSSDEEAIPALIGTRMAQNTGLKKGDYLTVQWRDVNGTFDARDVKIVEVMQTTVQDIDNGQLWLPLEQLQTMTGLPGEATLIVLSKGSLPEKEYANWSFKDVNYLLRDLREMVEMKTVGASIIYIVLLLLAMLAIFNTQILSIFRRRKEMGTLMALGMTRIKIIQLFTLEGAMHGILAALVAAVYGIPLLVYTASKGWALPDSTDSYGFAIGEKIFPVYGTGLVVGTIALVLIVTTIVSFLPTRKIVKLKPTDALRGKLS
jgi:putative ABC transport system permease protein